MFKFKGIESAQNGFIVFCSVMILLLGSVAIYSLAEKEVSLANSDKTETLCRIEEKTTQRELVGKIYVQKYYLYVAIDGEDNGEMHKVQVPADVYQTAEIGKHIKCVVYFNDDGIIDVQIWNP